MNVLSATRTYARTGIALFTAAAIAVGSFFSSFPANAQTVKFGNPPTSAPQPISRGACNSFGSYIMDESDTFGTKLSSTFLDSISRFVGANCGTRDAKGVIQIITITGQDAASLRTARVRMGDIDIFSRGVVHCDRPKNGVCPAPGKANTPKGTGD